METEITVQVFNSLEETKEILKNQGYKVIEKYTVMDYYFSKYSLAKLKQLSYKSLIKNSFLVRAFNDNNTRHQLCYKDKNINEFNQVISEKKVIAKTDNVAIDVFKNANLTNWCVVNNFSLVYQKGNINFCVQVIDNLGIFIEYEEDEAISHLSIAEKRNFMIDNVKSLPLKLGDDYSCKKPYMILHQ